MKKPCNLQCPYSKWDGMYDQHICTYKPFDDFNLTPDACPHRSLFGRIARNIKELDENLL